MTTELVVAFVIHGCPEDITQKYFNATNIAELNMSFQYEKGIFYLFSSLSQNYS